ncbi:hypothetical protein [Devosia sp.]|uniref:hypothetical protein n=1 Tax=Devosia sp. TaxID=1871048 RepID=UPI0032672C94
MRHTIIRLVAGLGAVLSLSACVESSTDPFAGMATVTPLPDKFMAVASSDIYVLERDGDSYRFTGEDDFDRLKVFTAAGDKLVLQISSKDAGNGFTYSIGTLDTGKMDLVEADHGAIAKSLGFGNATSDADTAELENADQIVKVLQAGITSDSADVRSYEILDYSVPEQKAKAREIIKHPPSNG